jgi:hypothetical protein
VRGIRVATQRRRGAFSDYSHTTKNIYYPTFDAILVVLSEKTSSPVRNSSLFNSFWIVLSSFANFSGVSLLEMRPTDERNRNMLIHFRLDA